ncbi:MAG TPA: MFS transporter [Burkholderiales bacterium]
MEIAKKNVAVLSACQALLFTNNSTVIALNGLAGYALAANKALATLPVTGWVVGAALTTFPASLLMKAVGRRAGFTLGALIGVLGAALCAWALHAASFWMLCLGTTVFGVYNAFAQYYRFAAADSASPEFRPKAISLVLAGGLVGGIIGPETSKLTVGLLPTLYLGGYLALIGFLALVIALLQLLEIPPVQESAAAEPARPLSAIMAQPQFVVAVVAAALGYGTMNLLMTASPLAMAVCGHPYGAAATVIGWHVIGMFGPSLFTGNLIRRFGVAAVMFAGVALQFVAIGIALSGISVPHFWFALVTLGVGWNFLYIGGTTLIAGAARPSERAKTQGVNDLIIFVVLGTSSFSSGLLLETNGWRTLNLLAAPVAAVIAVTVAWFALKRRGAPVAA